PDGRGPGDRWRALRGGLPRSAVRLGAREARARCGGGGPPPARRRGGGAPARDQDAADGVARRALTLEGAPLRGDDLDFLPARCVDLAAFSDISRQWRGG